MTTKIESPRVRRAAACIFGAGVAGALAVLLSACGGGGGAGNPAEMAVARVAQPAKAVISGRAVDGPLQGAVACLDIDADGACGTTEPRAAAPTAADGRFTIEVDAALAGQHRVLVEVPATAIDSYTGASVGIAFTMVAPASGTNTSHSVFVSPLSTLVQAQMDQSGAGRAEAEAHVRAQGRLSISPLADFGAAAVAGTPEAKAAALLARLVQATANAQMAELAPALGTLLRAADIEHELRRTLVAGLATLADAAEEDGLVRASGENLQAGLRATADSLAAQFGLSADTVRAAHTVARLAEPPQPAVPVAGATMSALRYTDADNWYYRSLRSSAADAVPDSNNYTRYYDTYVQSAPSALNTRGIVRTWSYNPSILRDGDLHWNGSAWVKCSFLTRYLTKVRDAQGRGDYNYCDGRDTGNGIRRLVDVSGQSIQAVVRDRVRAFPGGSAGVSFSAFGPSNLALWGSAVFPPNSVLIYQTNTITSTAFIYDVQTSAQVTVYNAAVAAGGDARVNPGLACNDPQQNSTAAQERPSTLEAVIARSPGKPCLFGQGGTAPNLSLDPNAWWSNSTVYLGDVNGVTTRPAGTGTYYTTNARLRVAFAPSGTRVTFYRCYQRTSDLSSRNCTAMGIGSWRIQTVGDARVMSFSVAPALAQRLGYARVLVERGGTIYFGFKNPVGAVDNDVRFNLTASNAMLDQLGLPQIRPVTQPGTAAGERAAALATMKGTWGGAGAGGNEALIFRIGDNGRFILAEANPYVAQTRTQTGAELGWLDFDPATGRLSTLLETDSNLTAGTSNPKDTDPPLTVSSTSLGGFSPLPNDDTGIVGLWAIGSASDLSVPHLAFFGNGRFLFVTTKDESDCFAANECPPGAEFGSYTWTPAQNSLLFFGMQYDTNGCAGAFDNCPYAVANGLVNTQSLVSLVVAPGGQTAVLTPSQSAPVTLYRIRPR